MTAAAADDFLKPDLPAPLPNPESSAAVFVDSDLGPITIFSDSSEFFALSAEDRLADIAKYCDPSEQPTANDVAEHEGFLRNDDIRDRAKILDMLNRLVAECPASETIIRECLLRAQKRVAGLTSFNDKLSRCAGSGAFRGQYKGRDYTCEYGNHSAVADGSYGTLFATLYQLGIEVHLTDDSSPDDTLLVETGTAELLRIATRIATGYGYRVNYLTNAHFTNVHVKQSTSLAKPAGEKERAFAALRALAQKGPVQHSDWIANVAAQQPADKDDAARKKLARTYAARLVEAGAVKRNADGTVQPVD